MSWLWWYVGSQATKPAPEWAICEQCGSPLTLTTTARAVVASCPACRLVDQRVSGKVIRERSE